MECGFYNDDGTICEFKSDDLGEMIEHIRTKHGSMELREFLEREGIRDA